MKLLTVQPRLSKYTESIIHPRTYRIKEYIKGIVIGLIMTSQIDIEKRIIFMERDSNLFQITNALYPNRVKAISNLAYSPEIVPYIAKKTEYNLKYIDGGLVIMNHDQNEIIIISIQAKLGKILTWKSGKIVS